MRPDDLNYDEGKPEVLTRSALLRMGRGHRVTIGVAPNTPKPALGDLHAAMMKYAGTAETIQRRPRGSSTAHQASARFLLRCARFLLRPFPGGESALGCLKTDFESTTLSSQSDLLFSSRRE